MDLLRYDKSEVHIDYGEYLNDDSDQTFSGFSPIHNKEKGHHGLPDEGAFNALSKQSSPNRVNSSSSSPLLVGCGGLLILPNH